MTTVRPVSSSVGARFATYPDEVREVALRLRELIFRAAESMPEVGDLEESLKWGEPAYRPKNGAGTTLRLDWKDRDPEHVALYVHCATTLIESWRGRFPEVFEFEGNRAAKLRWAEALPEQALAACFLEALTYHLED